MSHEHRFFSSPGEQEPERITLREQEAHHALHVVRLRKGDRVIVFDGRGREWSCLVSETGRKDVQLAIESSRTAVAPRYRLDLLLGALHRDKALEEVIQRGTEIGVSRFVFFRAERSERAAKVMDKWHRWAVESCKQCGRLWLPAFAVADSLEAAMADTPVLRLIATLNRSPIPIRTCVDTREAAVIVGPEGDFTDRELALAESLGAKAFSLGGHVFRAEVAAALAAGLVLYEWGELG
ncbi:MAG: ribosomal RNA small subunit methyltransferase E [Candidatus Hydrogenedentota bacterium]